MVVNMSVGTQWAAIGRVLGKMSGAQVFKTRSPVSTLDQGDALLALMDWGGLNTVASEQPQPAGDLILNTTRNRAPAEPQAMLTRAALSTCGHAKSKFHRQLVVDLAGLTKQLAA